MCWKAVALLLVGPFSIVTSSRLARGQSVEQPPLPAPTAEQPAPSAPPTVRPFRLRDLQPGLPAAPEPIESATSSEATSGAAPSTELPTNAPDIEYGQRHPLMFEEEGYPFNAGTLELPGMKTGWLFSAEANLVGPQLHSKMTSGADFEAQFPGRPVETPLTHLDWTVSPRLELTYRWKEGLGETRLGFRTMNSSGDGTNPFFDPAGVGQIHTRLAFNVFDLDYCCTELHEASYPKTTLIWTIPGRLGMNRDMEASTYGPPLQLRWTWGARYANVFFDTQGAGQQVVFERMTNLFNGAGLNFATTITKCMPWNPLALYAEFGCSGLYGCLEQQFIRREIVNGAVVEVSSKDVVTTGLPIMSGEFGVSFIPSWRNKGCRLTCAYQAEQWWCLGQTERSNASLFFHGAFLRAEFGY